MLVASGLEKHHAEVVAGGDGERSALVAEPTRQALGAGQCVSGMCSYSTSLRVPHCVHALFCDKQTTENRGEGKQVAGQQSDPTHAHEGTTVHARARYL